VTPAPNVEDQADDGMRLVARLPSAKMHERAHEELLAVTIAAPRGPNAARPSPGRQGVSVAIVLDRSASMSDSADGSSTPWTHAKAAAARLVDQLADGDAVSIVGYAETGATYLPMSIVGDQTRRRARAVLAELQNETSGGATCISCGLTSADGELARTQTAGVRRIILISDGQANATVSGKDGDVLYAKEEAIEVAERASRRGASVTAMGVGLGFDEATMIKIADIGRGNYYFVDDPRDLPKMFEHELGGLAKTIATDVKLLLSEGNGFAIEEALGYPMQRLGDHVIVPIADLQAGETRKVVFRVKVAASAQGPRSLTRVQLGWRRPDGAVRKASTTAMVDVVGDPAEVAASLDPATVQVVQEALTARTLEAATRAYASEGKQAALQIIEDRTREVQSIPSFPPSAAQPLRGAHQTFSGSPEPHSEAGERLKKEMRDQAHGLAR
jgi:Ca-activated chloride channel family protein